MWEGEIKAIALMVALLIFCHVPSLCISGFLVAESFHTMKISITPAHRTAFFKYGCYINRLIHVMVFCSGNQ